MKRGKKFDFGRMAAAAAAAGLTLLLAAIAAQAFPLAGEQGVLPEGTDFGEDSLDAPREIFKSEAAGGKRSYLLDLGDMAFNAPALFGGPARQAGLSCNSCHVNGTGNARLYVPGLSTRPGNFDTTGALFNPAADNGVTDALTPPSLRGARMLAPYGHDGRFASLRDFVRNVIVNEFAGAEPSPEILDALVVYIQEIEFLPNAKLMPEGKLAKGASESEKRGEALFTKPFPYDAAMSCAACHVPSAGFVDHRQHDVGTGGAFKTPTLRNANFNAPYFHDGRFDGYADVVAYFDREFGLGLSARDQKDLVAYLKAVGEGERAFEPARVAIEMDELDIFAGVLQTALPARNADVAALTVDTVTRELRELTEFFPERKNTAVTAGKSERGKARAALKELVLMLHRVGDRAAEGKFEEAASLYADYRKQAAEARPVLEAAEPYSLFNPSVRSAHIAALTDLMKSADVATP
jgi:cytochrome c peroxidase